MMYRRVGPRASQTPRIMTLAIAGFLAVMGANASQARHASKDAADAGARAFVDSIYERYVGSSAEAAKGVPLANANTVRGYFTVGMASLIIEDRASAAKHSEAPVLDGDPFVGRQDWDIANLAIEVKDAGAVKATATVTFTDSGKPGKVVLELLRSGKEWRIADIEWESGTLRGLYRRKAAQDNQADLR